MCQGQGLIIVAVLGFSDDPKDADRKEENDPTLPESDQEKQEERRENVGPDNHEWQENQLKEDPNRDEGLRDKPQVDRPYRPRDSI